MRLPGCNKLSPFFRVTGWILFRLRGGADPEECEFAETKVEKRILQNDRILPPALSCDLPSLRIWKGFDT